jgi:lysophospholipase L1-like esterase
MTTRRRGILLTVVAVVLAAALALAWVVAQGFDTASADEPGDGEAIAGPTVSPPWQPHRVGRIEVTDDRLDAVFLGDSITYGQFASTEAKGYRPRVISALRAAAGAAVDVEGTRFGAPGLTTRQVAEEATVPEDAELVVIALGTNDVKRTRLEDFEQDYASLVETVTTTAPDATLVCLGVWAEQGVADVFDPFISDPCRDAGGVFLPLADLHDAEGTRGPEGVRGFAGVSDLMHPNDRGFAAIAARLTRAIGLG